MLPGGWRLSFAPHDWNASSEVYKNLILTRWTLTLGRRELGTDVIVHVKRSSEVTVCSAAEKSRHEIKLMYERNLRTIKAGPRAALAGKNPRLLLLCQTRLMPRVQMCSGATLSHPHPSRGGDSPDSARYFTHLSISTHRPTAWAPPAKPHNACQLAALP